MLVCNKLAAGQPNFAVVCGTVRRRQGDLTALATRAPPAENRQGLDPLTGRGFEMPRVGDGHATAGSDRAAS